MVEASDNGTPRALWFDGPTIPPSWIDHNGHMNLARYSDAFYLGVRQLSNTLGFSREFKKRTRTASFAAKMNITYIEELREDDQTLFEARIVGFDARRIHAWFGLWHEAPRRLAATCEMLSLNIDTDERRVTDMTPEAIAAVQALHEAHRQLDPPQGLGEGIVV